MMVWSSLQSGFESKRALQRPTTRRKKKEEGIPKKIKEEEEGK